jgi:hypothetical protein
MASAAAVVTRVPASPAVVARVFLRWNPIRTRLGSWRVLEVVDADAMLDLVELLDPADGQKARVDRAAELLERVARMLYGEKVFEPLNAPRDRWRDQAAIVIMAAGLDGVRGRYDNDRARHRLSAWYWNRMLFDTRTLPVLKSDVEATELRRWLLARARAQPPRRFRDDHREILATEVIAASRDQRLGRAMRALMLRTLPRDWLTGELIETHRHVDDPRLDLHHIFPRAWCDSRRPPIAPKRRDSIANLTPLSSYTNRSIGGLKKPASYLRAFEQAGIARERLAILLGEHFIEIDLVRSERFEEFLAARAGRLAHLATEAASDPQL